jgi:hypothetical protein
MKKWKEVSRDDKIHFLSQGGTDILISNTFQAVFVLSSRLEAKERERERESFGNKEFKVLRSRLFDMQLEHNVSSCCC